VPLRSSLPTGPFCEGHRMATVCVLEGVKKALVDEVIIEDDVICGHTYADRDKRDSRFGWRQGPHWVRFGRNRGAIATFRLLRAAMSELIGTWFVTHSGSAGGSIRKTSQVIVVAFWVWWDQAIASP